MADSTASPRPRRWWSFIWRFLLIGCGSLLLLSVFVCGGAIWLVWSSYRESERQADEFFRDALAGDVLKAQGVREQAKAIHAAADARFREHCTLDQFVDFVEAHPHFFSRDQLQNQGPGHLIGGETIVYVAAALGTAHLFFAPAPDGTHRLVGVRPGLETAIPAWAVNKLERRNHRHHDWFD